MRKLLKVLRILVPLIVLGWLAWRGFTAGPRWPDYLRRLVVDQASRALGQAVRIGSVRGDPARHLVLTDVVVAPDKMAPGGALFTADKVSVDLRAMDALKGRIPPAEAVTRIHVLRPRIYVARNRRGEWSFMRLVKKKPPPKEKKPVPFRALIVLEDARIDYDDAVFLSPDGRSLQRRLKDVQARIDFADNPFPTFEVRGIDEGRELGAVAVSGAFGLMDPYVELDADVRRAGVPYWASHFVRVAGLELRGGQAGGTVHVGVGPNPNGEGVGVTYSGRVRVSGLGVSHTTLPLPFENIQGVVAFNERQFRLEGVTSDFGNTHVHVDGDVMALPEMPFRATILSDHLDIGELHRTFAPADLRPQIEFDGVGGCELAIAGTLSQSTISGSVQLPGATVRDASFGAVTTPRTEVRAMAALPRADWLGVQGLLSPIDLTGLHIGDPSAPSVVDASQAVDLQVDLRGPATDPYVGVFGRLPRLCVAQTVLEDVQVSAAYAGRKLEVQSLHGAVGGGEVKATAKIDLAGDRASWRGQADVQGVAASSLAPYLAATPLDLDGRLTGRLHFNGGPGENHLDLRVGADEVTVTVHPAKPDDAATVIKAPALDTRLTVLLRQDAPQHNLVYASGPVSAKTVNIGLPGDQPRTLAVSDFAGEFGLSPEGLDLTTASGEVLGSALRAHDIHLPTGEEGTLSGRIEIRNLALARVGEFADRSGWSGVTQADLKLSGKRATPIISGKVELLRARIENYPIALARAEVELRPDAITVQSATIHQYGGLITAKGALTDFDTESGDGKLEGRVGIVNLRLDKALSTAGLSVDVSGPAYGAVTVAGTLRKPTATGQVTVTNAELYGIPVDSGVVQASFGDRKLTVKDARLRTSSGEIHVHGRADLDRNAQLEATWKKIPAVSVLAPMGLATHFGGQLAGKSTVTIKQGKVGVSGQLAADDLTLRGEPLGRLTAEATYEDGSLVLSKLLLVRNGERWEAGGILPVEAGDGFSLITYRVQGLLLEKLTPVLRKLDLTLTENGHQQMGLTRLVRGLDSLPGQLAGSADVSGKVTGSLRDPRVQCYIDLKKCACGARPLPDLETEIAWQRGELEVSRLVAEQGEAVILVREGGRIESDGKLLLTVDIHNLDASMVSLWVPRLKSARGVLDATIVATGEVARPQLTCSVDAREIRWGEYRVDQVSSGPFRIEEGAITFDEEPGFIVSRDKYQLQAWGQVPFSWDPVGVPRHGELDVNIRLLDGDLGLLPLYIPAIEKADGPLKAELRVRGRVSHPLPSGQITIEKGRLTIASLDMPVSDIECDVRMDETTQTISFRKAQARVAEGRLQLEGGVRLAAMSAGNVPENAYSIGLAVEGIDLSRHGVPDLTGFTTHLRLDTRADGREVVKVDDLKAYGVRGGVVEGSGRVVLNPNAFHGVEQFARSNFDLHLKARELQVARRKVARGRVDAELVMTNLRKLSDENARARLQKMKIPAYTPVIGGRIDISSTDLLGMPPREKPTESATVFPTWPAFAVAVNASDKVRVHMSRLEVPFSARALIVGTPARPVVEGDITAQRGTVRFPAATCRITGGTVQLAATRDRTTGELVVRTNVDVSAEGDVDQHHITLHFHGPYSPSDPQAKLDVDASASPPLSENELFAKLIGMQSGGDSKSLLAEGGLSGAMQKQLVGIVAGSQLFRGIEDTLAKTLGLETFKIEYRFQESVNVKLGKQFAKNLFISYYRSVGAAAEEYRFTIDYRLGKRTLLGWEIDERGEQTYQVLTSINF